MEINKEAAADLLAMHKELAGMSFVKSATGQTGNRNYKYMDLPDLMSQLSPVMHKHNFIWFSKPAMADGVMTLYYTLMHTSGWTSSAEVPLPSGGLKPQEIGGLITYFRRYAVTAHLGIIADEDDDAAKANEGAKLANKKLKDAGDAGRKRENDIYTMLKRISVNVEDYEERLATTLSVEHVTDLTIVQADAEIAKMNAFINRQAISKAPASE